MFPFDKKSSATSKFLDALSDPAFLLQTAGIILAAVLLQKLLTLGARHGHSWAKLRSTQEDLTHQMTLRRWETRGHIFIAITRMAIWLAAVILIFETAFPNREVALISVSMLAAVLGIAGQQFLRDIIAGIAMNLERWFEVGDTITIEPWNMQGVVEKVTLRATRLRGLNGEEIWIHNSFMYGARVARRGVREIAIEAYVRDAELGQIVFEETAMTLPDGPLHLVTPLHITEQDALSGGKLIRIQARATVPAGREWLIDDFACAIVKEKAAEHEGLLMHGPITYYTDQVATDSFTRSVAPALEEV